MDRALTLISRVRSPAMNVVEITTTDGSVYSANLKSLSKVYCFPKSLSEWKKVSVDSFGRALIWQCRFEVHIDQILGLAQDKKSPARRSREVA